MIVFIKGKLEEKGQGYIDVDAGGIGYRVFMSNNSLCMMPQLGEPVFIYTYLQVREDSMQLFGFYSVEERELFEKLISISGIGPKVALAVLSVFEVNAFKKAVAEEDVLVISSVPGIGKKTAQRIVLELKDKVLTTEFVESTSIKKINSTIYEEARSALLSLGYSNAEAKKALEGVNIEGKDSDDIDLSVEKLVKQALKNLVKT